MKIIVSHDIDHSHWSDHFLTDLYLPKYLVRNYINFFGKKITAQDLLLRHKNILQNKQHRVKELAEFNKAQNIPATFFLAVNQGRSLAYNNQRFNDFVDYLADDFDLGIHGINYTDIADMGHEKEVFADKYHKPFGIRMHTLAMNMHTLSNMNSLGYQFDTSIYGLLNPFKVGNLVEFPISLMDVYAVREGQTFKQIQKNSIDRIEEALKLNLEFFTIIFHDVYFDDAFPKQRDWYLWIIDYLKNKFNFSTFDVTKIIQ